MEGNISFFAGSRYQAGGDIADRLGNVKLVADSERCLMVKWNIEFLDYLNSSEAASGVDLIAEDDGRN
jgi:hypothetical protein